MAKNKRKIAVFSGKRGGFGAMMGLMKLIEKNPATDLSLIVADMHLSNYFGYTAREVEKFFKISHKLNLGQKDDSGEERTKALAKCTSKMAKALKEIRPDILLTLGDRGEVLSAAIAAMEMNIPIAHILGGDLAGNRDGNRIHAITKLAHLHFPSSKDAYERMLKLGEEKWRVHNVGATYVDYIVQKKYTPNAGARKKYGVKPDENYFLCIQHPTTLTEKDSYKESKTLFEALKKKGEKVIATYPCSDQGYKGVVKAIKEFEKLPQFKVYKNIEALDFWGLMSGASLFIGNSSAGLMETPYFNLPAVNLGRRQLGRIRNNNVLDAPYERKAVEKAIEKALSGKFKSQIKNNYIFGRGRASEKIFKVLKNTELSEKLLMKKITY